MKKVKITLEVVTSMLSFGDNNKSEFRITELKSLMRSTFREIYCFKDVKDMKEKESMLFGNMTKKSPISFKIKDVILEGKKEVFMLPHRETIKRKGITNCLGESSKIIFYIITSDNVNIQLYINLLIQASILGAMGKRSRKGFGSFRIIDIEGFDNDTYKDLLMKSPIEIFNRCSISSQENYNNLYTVRNIRKCDTGNKKIEQLIFYACGINECLNFPYVTKVNFIQLDIKKQYSVFIKNISKLTHDRLFNEKKESFVASISNKENINKNILGNYRGKRFASPIYVTFFENLSGKYLVIKELNYKYFLKDSKIKDDDLKVNQEYINKYITELMNIEGESTK